MANQVQIITPERFKQEIVLASTDIAKMLPKHIEFDKFQGMVMNVVTNTPKLLECTQNSLIRSVIDAADLGLSLNPQMREADILPIWSPGGMVAQCRARAIGMMKLARQSGAVKKIAAHEVYENDLFDVEYAPEEKLTHKPCLTGERGGLTHAYCIWTLADGTTQFEVIDQVRIDRAKQSSEAYKYAVKNNSKTTPWIQDEPEMWRKTAIRAASKYMPMSSENESFLRAMNMEDEIQGEYEDVTDKKAAEEAARPSSGATQTKALEHKLGVGEQKGSITPETPSPTQSQQTNHGQQNAQGATQTAERTASSASPSPSDTSNQGNSQNGGATSASPSEPAAPRRRSRQTAAPAAAVATGPREEPPPPNGPEDYGRGGEAPQRQDKAQQKAPAGDEWDDDAAEAIDFAVEARKMRAEILNVGSDLGAWKKFMTDSKSMRDKMEKGSPGWYERVKTMILEKEEWFRSK